MFRCQFLDENRDEPSVIKLRSEKWNDSLDFGSLVEIILLLDQRKIEIEDSQFVRSKTLVFLLLFPNLRIFSKYERRKEERRKRHENSSKNNPANHRQRSFGKY